MGSRRLFFLLLATCCVVQSKRPLGDFKISVQKDRAVERVGDKFVSVTLDAGIIVNHWKAFNPNDSQAVTLALALSPAYLRLGGTTADSLIFVGQEHEHGAIPNSTFTASDWDKLNIFAQKSNFSLIFGLNSLYRSGMSWDPTNAVELMKYSAQKGYVLDLELGNEPDIYPAQYGRTVEPKQLSDDFRNLRSIMDGFPSFKSRQLFGPDTMTDSTQTASSSSYLQSFMENGSEFINAMTFHHYYLDGHTASAYDFIDPSSLDSLMYGLTKAKDIISRSNGTKTFWLGETSTASGGGAPGLSNTFLAGFMWLDKLGLSALHGVGAVLRQDFCGLNYGLVEYSNGTYTPNPDYWLTVLFKNLVGENVLQTQGSDDNLRVYSHCTNNRSGYASGSVTFYMMNLYRTATNVIFSQFAGKEFHIYVLSSGDQLTLATKSVLLNGKPLELSSGQLPPLLPVIQNSTRIYVKPFTMQFVVVPEAEASACS